MPLIFGSVLAYLMSSRISFREIGKLTSSAIKGMFFNGLSVGLSGIATSRLMVRTELSFTAIFFLVPAAMAAKMIKMINKDKKKPMIQASSVLKNASMVIGY